MSTRVPTSSSGTQSPVPAHQPRAGTRAQASTAAPRPIRTDQQPALVPPKPEKAAPMGTAAQLWAGVDIDRSLEISKKELEARLAEDEVTNAGAEEAADEVHAQVRESAERDEGKLPGLGKAWEGMKAQLHKFSAPGPKQGKVGQQSQAPVKEQPTAPARPAVARPAASASSAASAANLKAVQKNMLAGSMREEKIPDAFALLKGAKEAGVLFVEDAMREGHSEADEDPELAAAVEECIRLCFGVRGILRIGAGHDEANEPIIVVTAAHGFTEASLKSVPERVHRFATLLAIPFDLLPLKRER